MKANRDDEPRLSRYRASRLSLESGERELPIDEITKVLPIRACPVCIGTNLATVTERTGVPVHQNKLHTSRREALSAARGHLTVVACLECGFAFNSTFDASLMSYGAGYESDQSYSSVFTAHVDRLLDLLLNDRGVRDARIIEVGSGKGTFLRALVESPGASNSGTGFDPTYKGPDVDLDGRLRFVRSFYTEEYDHIPADVAIFRHVVEHVPDPVSLLARIRNSSEKPLVFMETKDLEWALGNAVIWDFFYEYCSYFSVRSVTAAFRRAGFGQIVSEHIFGGQYLWVEAAVGRGNLHIDHAPPGVLEDLIMSYKLREYETKARWRETIASLRSKGPVAMWGAGAKGATFVSLFDPRAELIAGVVDLNPAKQNKFIAGSGHAIISPDKLKEMGVKSVVLLNPNYALEVQDFLAAEKLDVTLLVDPDTGRIAN